MMSKFHVHDVTGVNILIQGPLNQILWFITRQLSDPVSRTYKSIFSKNIQISLLPLKISNTQYTPFLKLNIKQIPRIKENEFQIEACTKHEHVAKHLHFRYGTGRK